MTQQLALTLVGDPELEALARKAPVLPRADNPVEVYLASFSARSRATMLGCLQRMAELVYPGAQAERFPWHELRYAHSQALRALLDDRFAPATVNKYLAALRGILKTCWRLERMSAEDYHRAADVADVAGSAIPAGRAVSAGELRALFAICAQAKGPVGARDAALIAVLYGGGLRRAEAIGLAVRDADMDTATLRVDGKGGKERLAYLDTGGVAAVRCWLAVRAVAGIELAGPLLVPVAKGGAIVAGKALTPRAVGKRLVHLARRAKVAHLSPHDLRRSFVSDLLDAGVDVATVQKMAGHAHVQTTVKYDRRPEEAKRAAAQRLHVPFTAGDADG